MSGLFLSAVGPTLRHFDDGYAAHWVKEPRAGWTQWVLLEPAGMWVEAMAKDEKVWVPGRRVRKGNGGRKGRN